MKQTCLLILLLFGIAWAQAQTQTINGTVIGDDDGLPVIGASVLVVGTSLGTITDVDGKFTIPNVPSSAKQIQVSYIGMKTLVVNIKPTMSIRLHSDAEMLEEVIVTAYGTATKSAFTGSATTVKADEIAKIQTSNVANALVGKVSGMQMATASGQPGTKSPTIRVRGLGSINAGNAPLIVVDGVPYDGDLNNINSQDVESMTVLKDAASNALYGSRGANGVIIITTKKGDGGKATITFDAKIGANTRAQQDYDLVKDPALYYEMYYSALNRYYQANGYSAERAYNQANTTMLTNLGYNVYTLPAGQNLIGTNGRLNPAATLGNKVTYKGQDYWITPDDWLAASYRQSMRQEYNFSATAGTRESSFYASINYMDNEGIAPNSGYNRINGRLRADHQIKPWIKVGGNVMYAHYEANSLSDDGSTGSSGNIFAIATRVAPIYPLYIRDGEGKIMIDSNGFQRYDYGNLDNAGLKRPFLGQSNAAQAVLLDTNYLEGNAVNASGVVDFTYSDFKLSTTNNVTVDETRQTIVTNPYYGQYASSNGIVTKYHVRGFSYDFQQTLKWKKSLGLNNLDILFGHEYYRTKYYELSADKSNMFNPKNTELNGAVVAGQQGSYTTDYNTEGFFFRGMYDFNEHYFGSVSFRRDASSRFHPDNRWGNFWSVGGSWIISKENFFHVDWINLLKVKVSYGQQGNDDIGNYRYTDTYSIINSSGNPAAVPSVKGNKDITWETNSNLNAGVEFELFDKKLTGEIAWFSRKTTDMLFSFPLPPSMGYTSYYANVGDMLNTGIEVQLDGTIIQTRDLTWDAKLNFTAYKNKVTYLPEERKTLETVDGVWGYSGSGQFIGEGIPLYTFYNKRYAGLNDKGEATYYKVNYKRDSSQKDGYARDSKGQRIIESTDKVTVASDATDYLNGTALPDAFGGFGTTISYKGFDLSADFTYQIGGLVYDGDYASFMSVPSASSSGTNFHKDLLNAWTETNTGSMIPRFQYADQYATSNSDRFLTDASFLSLQNIQIGYNLPSSICQHLGMTKLRIYAVCDNVYYWSKRKGFDPRQTISGSTTSAYYSPIRTFSGGLTLTF